MKSFLGTVSVIGLLAFSSFAQAESEVRVTAQGTTVSQDSVQTGSSPTSTVELSLSGSDESKEPGFLYFKQLEPVDSQAAQVPALDWTPSEITTFTPRALQRPLASDAFSDASELSSVESFTPRYADAHISVSYGNPEKEGQQLDIALSSSVRVEESLIPGLATSPSLTNALSRQAMDVGVNIGYSGFNFGASVRTSGNPLLNSFSGYDIGFAYSGKSWSTSLLIGEYSQKYRNIYAPLNSKQKSFYALEFGASYRVYGGFSLSGGIRYFGLGGQQTLGLWDPRQVQEFYLGTSLNF